MCATVFFANTSAVSVFVHNLIVELLQLIRHMNNDRPAHGSGQFILGRGWRRVDELYFKIRKVARLVDERQGTALRNLYAPICLAVGLGVNGYLRKILGFHVQLAFKDKVTNLNMPDKTPWFLRSTAHSGDTG